MVPDVACKVPNSSPYGASCSHRRPLSDNASGQDLAWSHHMVRVMLGLAQKDRWRRAWATKPQAVFKTVAIRLKIFPLRQSCGVVSIEQVAGCKLSVCLAGCGLASPSFLLAGWPWIIWLPILSGPSFSHAVSSYYYNGNICLWQWERCSKTRPTEIRPREPTCSPSLREPVITVPGPLYRECLFLWFSFTVLDSNLL